MRTRNQLAIILAVLLVCGNLWAGGLFPGTGGGGSADEVTYDNTASGLTATNLKDAVDEVATMAGTGGLVSVDDLPGDTVNDTKIDVGLLPTGATSSTVSLGNHTHDSLYQPLDSDLTTWAGVTPSAHGQALVAAANYAAMRGLLDVEAGTDYNAYSAILAGIAGTTPIAGYLHYTGSAYEWANPSGSSHDAVTLGADADVLLGLSTQQLTLDSQSANTVFAGPNGSSGAPTFRALVDADVPDTITVGASGSVNDAAIPAGITRDTEWDTISEIETATSADIITATEIGTKAQAHDADLDILAEISITGSPLRTIFIINGDGDLSTAILPYTSMTAPGAGIPVSTGSAWGTSYTVGTSANNLVQLNSSGALPAVSGANLTSVNAATLGGATFAAPGAIGGTTAAAGTFTTLSAGAAGFTVDADGDVTAKSLTIAKASGTAGTMRAYEANSTDTDTVGWMGPASISSSWDYQFSSTQPAANSIMLFGAPSSNISAQTWITLDDTGTNGDTAKLWSADKCYDQDALRLALSGGTLTGALITAASTTSAAGIRLPHGSAPTSPTNGDLWTTTGGLYARINGSTVGPFGTGGGGLSGSGSAGHMAYWSGASGLTYDSDGGFYWDATNNRLGIGTTSPTNPLQVGNVGEANSDTKALFEQSIFVGRSGGRQGIVTHSSSTYGEHIFGFNYATSAGVDITLQAYGGNVGIGTTTPSQALELGASKWLSFEGATANDYETTFDVIDPTADRTITAPDASGTMVLHSNTQTLTNKTLSTGTVVPVTIGIACSDESTALTIGTAKATFRMPHAMTLTAVRASVGTAPVGSTIIVDINEGGSTIMTTNKLSIDASEETSTTAATAAGITDSALADDAEITIDIDQIGSTTAGAGLKVWLIGTRTL